LRQKLQKVAKSIEITYQSSKPSPAMDKQGPRTHTRSEMYHHVAEKCLTANTQHWSQKLGYLIGMIARFRNGDLNREIERIVRIKNVFQGTTQYGGVILSCCEGD
jgi:hypothetical protein